MKNIVYTLGLTLLCSLPAWAQETPIAEAPVINAEKSAPIDAKAASAISEAVDGIINEKKEDEIKFIPEEQTIFFDEDLLNEVDEELKAPILINEDTPPLLQEKIEVPNVQIPENVKIPTPIVKVGEVLDNQPIIEIKEDALDIESEASIPNVVPSSQPERPQVAPIAIVETPAEAPKLKNVVESVVEDKPIQALVTQPNAENVVPTPVVTEEAIVINKEIVEETSVAPILKEAPTEPKAETPVMKEASAPISAPSTESDIDKIQAMPTPAPKAAPLPQPLAPKNDFSLDADKTAPSVKKNSFSLDDKAPIPSKLLENNALTPNIINRNIINISPEQRAKMMMKKKYDEMDSNQDGMVSEEEFVEYKTNEAKKIARQVFKQIDRNEDKKLSEYEYAILMNKMIESYIKQPRKK